MLVVIDVSDNSDGSGSDGSDIGEPSDLATATELRIAAAVAAAEAAKDAVIAAMDARIAQLEATVRAHAAAAEATRRARVSTETMKSEINLINAQRGFALTKGSTIRDMYPKYMSRNDLYNQHGMMAVSQARELVIKAEVEAIVPKAVFDEHLEDLDLLTKVISKGASMKTKKATLVFWMITDELRQQHA